MTKKSEKQDIRGFIDKIVINAGVGKASTSQANFEDKVLAQIIADLSLVAGQRPQVRRAIKSVAGFKIREGQIVGVRATLRGSKMVDFFERLIRIVLPRVRDFGGIDHAKVDEYGSLNIGFKEQFVFPEIDPETSTFIFPLGINIVPKMRDREKAVSHYQKIGVPFKK